MKEITWIIVLPVLTGFLLFLVPEKLRSVKGYAALLVSIITGYLTLNIYRGGNLLSRADKLNVSAGVKEITATVNKYLTFNCDNLSRLIVIFISLFTILIL